MLCGAMMFRRVSLALSLLSWLALGCAARPAPQATRVIPTEGHAPRTEAPATIAAEALFVSYAGAEGASSEVTRSKAEAAARAELLANTARSGQEKFKSLVGSYSDRPGIAPSSAAGAKLTRDSSLLPTAAIEAAFALQPREVSAPVETPAGYVIVKRMEDPAQGPRVVSARHILISYKGARRASEAINRSKEEARLRAEALRAEVTAEGADWVTIATENTDEPGARNGGDLGTFGRGQMVPAFERAAFSMKPGEVSQVVESPFGFHIIQRYK